MPQARSGRIILTAVFVIAGILVLGSATGKLPPLERAWESLRSSVADWTSPRPATAHALPTDAGAASRPDASAPVHRQTAPLSSAQLGAPLVHGTFVASCGAPDDMKVTVKIDIKMGRATNVSVVTQPANPAVASCIERAIRDVQWDVSPKVDHVTVTY